MELQSKNPVSLKRRLRELKRLEVSIRFGGATRAGGRLIWDAYFDLRDAPSGGAKYGLRELLSLDRAAYRAVIDAYFARVYFEYYRENGLTPMGTYDPSILAQLDLPFDADESAVKKRFRALAKRHHPDQGGDAQAFIELMRAYRALTGK
ncbi:MAG: DnaJ domain-containing protein [Christensenellales bacterium]